MDILEEKEAFEKLPEIKKRLDMKCVHFNGIWYATNPHMGNSFATAGYLNGAWMAWQATKAQAVPEGYVLVPKEPYAYLIKHKLWKKDSDPEIFLAVDFLGDDGIEKDKLTVCTPLYLGDDEAQEPAND